MRGKLTENAKWTVLLHAVNLLFWLQFAANGIMAGVGSSRSSRHSGYCAGHRH